MNRTDSSHPRCLNITEKVSFNMASEASYVYILSNLFSSVSSYISVFYCITGKTRFLMYFSHHRSTKISEPNRKDPNLTSSVTLLNLTILCSSKKHTEV